MKYPMRYELWWAADDTDGLTLTVLSVSASGEVETAGARRFLTPVSRVAIARWLVRLLDPNCFGVDVLA